MANRRYSIGDAECAEILRLKEGKEKKHRMKEFSKKLLLEGGNAYFDQLSTTCDMAFDYIEDAAKRNAATPKAEIGKYTADIQNFSEEKERQKQEIQGRLDKLFA